MVPRIELPGPFTYNSLTVPAGSKHDPSGTSCNSDEMITFDEIDDILDISAKTI